MMMVPEAWENQLDIDPKRRAFYEFHSMLMEPWDGPAALVFTDGGYVGATLDRNGLRPGRFLVTDDGLVVLASEIGVLDFPADRIVRKGRLRPGKMLLVDTAEGRIVEDDEIKAELAASQPWQEWLDAGRIHLAELPEREHITHTPASVDPAPAHLRLHRGGGAHPPHADGGDRRRTARRDGIRHADRRAQRAPAPALRLLHAAVRAGDEPAARLDPRRGRHLDEARPRPGAQPARRDPGARPPGRARLPDHRQRRAREDPPHHELRRTGRSERGAKLARVIRGLYRVDEGTEALAARLAAMCEEADRAIETARSSSC